MLRFLVYAAPFSRDVASSWYKYRDRIVDLLTEHSDARVIVDDDPIFNYGVGPAPALARVNETRAGAGEVIVAQWTAFDSYSASVVFLGEGVSAESITSALSSETLVREHAGELAMESARMFCYEPNLFTESGLATVMQLAERMPNRVYVADRPTVNNGEAEIDHDTFEIVPRPGGDLEAAGLVVFRPRTAEAESEILQEAWHAGLAMLEPGDPLLADLTWFNSYNNQLAIFLGRDTRRDLKRVMIGRCHQDDAFVAVYGHPVGDLPLYFFV